MKGYSHSIADRLSTETGRTVEHNPLSMVSPYVIECTGARDATEVRRLAREMDEAERVEE